VANTIAEGREALSQALAEDGDRLYALALRVTRDPGLAADAVQEAFLSALEHLDSFRGDAKLGTWLHRIVFTKSIDLLRRRSREVPLPDADSPDGVDSMTSTAAWAQPPDELLLSAESRQALDAAVGQLTPVQRAIFELREVEGRPTEEVAEILGIPAATVRVYLHRARLRLRALLRPLMVRGRA
jgi:RNA polymerase sigma-70 factor (ECF subfamily)